MVKAKQAMKWLKEGKKVVSPSTEWMKYIYLKDNVIIIRDDDDSEREAHQIDAIYFGECNDWKIYGEEHIFNKDGICSCGYDASTHASCYP